MKRAVPPVGDEADEVEPGRSELLASIPTTD